MLAENPQSRSVPSGQEAEAKLADSARFYAAHLSRESSTRHIPPDREIAPAGSPEEPSDRDAMLNEAAHIFAASHFHGYDARYINNPRLDSLMDRGGFGTTEVRNIAIQLGLLSASVVHTEQVPDITDTAKPLFAGLRRWLSNLGHSDH